MPKFSMEKVNVNMRCDGWGCINLASVRVGAKEEPIGHKLILCDACIENLKNMLDRHISKKASVKSDSDAQSESGKK